MSHVLVLVTYVLHTLRQKENLVVVRRIVKVNRMLSYPTELLHVSGPEVGVFGTHDPLRCRKLVVP